MTGSKKYRLSDCQAALNGELTRSYEKTIKCDNVGGTIAQWLAYLFPDPAALGLIPSVSGIFLEKKIVNVSEVNQQCCLEESEQWLENIDRTFWLVVS